MYATDHEPHSPPPSGGVGRAEVRARAPRGRAAHRVPAGADLVIHDAQYTLEEYPARLTWGHTPAEMAVDFAGAARARAPGAVPPRPLAHRRRARRAARALPRRARRPAGWRSSPPIEGRELVDRAAAAPAAGALAPAVRSSPRAARRDETTILRRRRRPRRHRCSSRRRWPTRATAAVGQRRRGRAATSRARSIRTWSCSTGSCPSVTGSRCAARSAPTPIPRLADVPVILITGRADAADTAAGFDAGVTDYLTKPFKPSHLLARLRSLAPPPPAPRSADNAAVAVDRAAPRRPGDGEQRRVGPSRSSARSSPRHRGLEPSSGSPGGRRAAAISSSPGCLTVASRSQSILRVASGPWAPGRRCPPMAGASSAQPSTTSNSRLATRHGQALAAHGHDTRGASSA